MGFWSTTGNVAKKIGEKVQETAAEVNTLAEKYSGEDDEWLKNKLKNGSAVQKMAANKVLKERGFSS